MQVSTRVQPPGSRAASDMPARHAGQQQASDEEGVVLGEGPQARARNQPQAALPVRESLLSLPAASDNGSAREHEEEGHVRAGPAEVLRSQAPSLSEPWDPFSGSDLSGGSNEVRAMLRIIWRLRPELDTLCLGECCQQSVQVLHLREQLLLQIAS